MATNKKSNCSKYNFYQISTLGFTIALCLFLSLFLILPLPSLFPLFHDNRNENNLQKEAAIVIPEYERTLEKVVISLSSNQVSLNYHLPLLQQLPKYSEIIVVVPQEHRQTIEKQVNSTSFSDRVSLVTFQTNPHRGNTYYLLFPEKDKLIQVEKNDENISTGSMWCQDLFEAAIKPDGSGLLLTPDVYKWFYEYTNHSQSGIISDTAFLETLSIPNFEIVKTPLAFKGGNLLFDTLDGKHIAFCGKHLVSNTRTVWRSTTDIKAQRQSILQTVQNSFNVDKVVVLGGKQQPTLSMFHLDQAVIFLEDMTVGVTRLSAKAGTVQPMDDSLKDNIKKMKKFLSTVRKTLIKLGYTVVDVKTSIYDACNHRFIANSIPFVNKETGQKTVLIPEYDNMTEYDYDLYCQNKALFTSLGYEIIKVPTVVDALNGGPHCLMNVVR